MVPLAGQAQSVEPADWTPPPRTPDGRPDLQGVWDYRTMTPLERPTSLSDTPFFTPEEAAAYERESVARRNKDRRTEDGLSVQADVAAAYNEFWWDYGKALSDLRTSLIVDPPDGRIPARTVEDPTTFERTWTFALPMNRNDGLVYEYACHEGNYGMVNLLRGARTEDAALAAAGSR